MAPAIVSVLLQVFDSFGKLMTSEVVRAIGCSRIVNGIFI
jgi:hypothetical protein